VASHSEGFEPRLPGIQCNNGVIDRSPDDSLPEPAWYRLWVEGERFLGVTHMRLMPGYRVPDYDLHFWVCTLSDCAPHDLAIRMPAANQVGNINGAACRLTTPMPRSRCLLQESSFPPRSGRHWPTSLGQASHSSNFPARRRTGPTTIFIVAAEFGPRFKKLEAPQKLFSHNRGLMA